MFGLSLSPNELDPDASTRHDHAPSCPPATRLSDALPLTPHPAGWYLGTMLLALAFIAAPALYGFWTSQAGRPFFRDDILEKAAER